MRFLYLALIVMVLVTAGALSSCKKSSSDKSAAVTVAGSWNGDVGNTAEGTSYSITFTLKQANGDISGEFSTYAAPGNITGSVSGNSVVFTLTPAASSGYTEVDTFKGTLNASANEIKGTWTSTESGSGTFDIKKQ